MQWIEARVAFGREDKELAQEIVTHLFLEMGLQGVVVEDPDEQPEEAWGEDAVAPPPGHAIAGFFPAGAQTAGKCRRLEAKLADLAAETGIETSVAYRNIDEEDWAESWKAFFWPERISASIVVKPTWREYRPEKGDRVLEIDPGMAFGTGTHPTTRLCVRMIEHFLKTGDKVLDIGTGSGILLIAAALLGAGGLTGVDNDPVAVEIAGRNLRLNHVEENRCSLFCGDLADKVSGRYDLVVSNILSDVVIRLSPEITRLLGPGGRWICSGIVDAHADGVAAAISDAGLVVEEKRTLENWVAFSARAPSRSQAVPMIMTS